MYGTEITEKGVLGRNSGGAVTEGECTAEADRIGERKNTMEEQKRLRREDWQRKQNERLKKTKPIIEELEREKNLLIVEQKELESKKQESLRKQKELKEEHQELLKEQNRIEGEERKLSEEYCSLNKEGFLKEEELLIESGGKKWGFFRRRKLLKERELLKNEIIEKGGLSKKRSFLDEIELLERNGFMENFDQSEIEELAAVVDTIKLNRKNLEVNKEDLKALQKKIKMQLLF